MILSRNFINDYVNLDKDLDITTIGNDMTNIGNEYAEAKKIVDVDNLVIGHVLDVKKHPNADTLNVCKVDLGEEIVQIVCGATNVTKDIKVIVAKENTVLPGGVIKKSTIRGVESNGMICALRELGIDANVLADKDPEWIYVLESDAKAGSDPISYLGLDDEIIDFELTANRGDLLSILGMAYELGALYKKEVKEMDISYNESSDKIDFELEVNTPNCSLYIAKKVTNIKIEKSPKFIEQRLIASGVRPINNVVDISNYVMLETGQPLHFFDLDKLGNKIEVRQAAKDEKIITLDNQERVLSEEDIVITDGIKPVALAGVMGGESTEIDLDTQNILIESAIFDGVSIRKTAKKTLRSEASNRFEKGLDPNRTLLAIERCCHLLEKYADATIISDIKKCDNASYENKVINLEINKVYKVLGIEITRENIIEILESLKFVVEDNNTHLKVEVPSRRGDISISEDLIEEVGRIYGMDNIKAKQPVLPLQVGKSNSTKRFIKNKLIDSGLNEVISYSLINEKDVKKYTLDNFTPIKIADPMTVERTTLRYSLISSLMEVYDYNKKRNSSDISIFEMGKTYFKENNEYTETEKLAALITGNYILDIKPTKADFYILKGIAEELLDTLGYINRYSFIVPKELPEELHPKASALINLQGKNIGIIGKIHPSITKEDIYVFELNIEEILKNKPTRMTYKEIPKYPSIIKDMAFIVPKETNAEEIITVIKKAGGKLLTNISIFDVYEGDNVLENEKSIAFNLEFMDLTKTLTDEEVMAVFNKIIKEVESKKDAKLRDK